MTTIKKENVQLTYHQQSYEIMDCGIQVMRGSLRMDHDNNVASFVEDCKSKGSSKNPVFWRGKHLSLRIDKEGKLRGTFRVDIPADADKCEQLLNRLDMDFMLTLDEISALSQSRRPKKKVKKTGKVA